jgi:hypothetical protein
MRRSALCISATLLTVALAACGDSNNVPTPRTSDASGAASAATASNSAPQATPDRDTPPAATPSTHSGAPQTDTVAAAPTARDTPAQNPAAPLTPAEEAKSMPKPGQTDNHFTTSLEQSQKSPAVSAPNQPAKQ